ncbi:MAG: DUF5615 family PIN-like protein [Ignavibacteria bacterium]|nr:DUF5615 family PIN-like protein [Ignavibacteria bacterium]HCN36370.1 hypothetical protein [Bacteroidota bacterium]
MKLLLDQNISFRLLKDLLIDFPESQHISKLNLTNKSDHEIWTYAKRNNYCIITFDSDFYDLSILYGHPPKTILLSTKNQTTSNLKLIIKKNKEIINRFFDENNISCLKIIDL